MAPSLDLTRSTVLTFLPRSGIIVVGLAAWEGIWRGFGGDTGCVVRQGVTIGAHGGYMDRSLSRLARLIGGAFAVVLLIAGCASNAPGAAVLGVPQPATSATPQASGDVVAGLELAIANELNAVNATPNGGGSPELLIELTALDNPGSLARAENFTRLLTLGANEATKREQLVLSLIEEVQSNGFIRGVTVGGEASPRRWSPSSTGSTASSGAWRAAPRPRR